MTQLLPQSLISNYHHAGHQGFTMWIWDGHKHPVHNISWRTDAFARCVAFTQAASSDLSANMFRGRKYQYHYDLVHLYCFPFQASQGTGQSIGGYRTSQEVAVLGLKEQQSWARLRGAEVQIAAGKRERELITNLMEEELSEVSFWPHLWAHFPCMGFCWLSLKLMAQAQKSQLQRELCQGR